MGPRLWAHRKGCGRHGSLPRPQGFLLSAAEPACGADSPAPPQGTSAWPWGWGPSLGWPLPRLAHPRFPSTHLLFSTPAKGRRGPQRPGSASAHPIPTLILPPCTSEGLRGPWLLASRVEEWHSATGARQRGPNQDLGCVYTGRTRTHSGYTDSLEVPLALFMTPDGFQNFSELQAPHLQNDGNNTHLALRRDDVCSVNHA